MNKSAPSALEPRKLPVQSRSVATVSAILEATIQVLLEVGRVRLTTTRVAERAGVSVGTLYQYFPNKRALLLAVLRDHLAEIAAAVEAACHASRGHFAVEIGINVVSAFITAKVRRPDISRALYDVVADVEGGKLASEVARKVAETLTQTLRETLPPESPDPSLVASMVITAMIGPAQALIEQGATPDHVTAVSAELERLVCSYLKSLGG